MSSDFFEEGKNCWKVSRAERAAMLVDGKAYFSALADALEKARRCVFILGWDIDSRIRLRREDDKEHPELGAFLNDLVAKREELHIYVLDWDFAMLYALDREPLPVFKLGWSTHKRLHFKLDEKHPVGACHHQKIVVIDDRLAFCGGMDLTHGRWDTPEHAPDDRRRRDNQQDQPPFHDVQLMVSGEAAAELGKLVRQRWHRAGGKQPVTPCGPDHHDPWPKRVIPEFENVEVAICRTEPQYSGSEQIQEVRRMWLDAIARARKSIYVENQYFTAHDIAAALEARLREKDGPEVVMVLSRDHTGWLEEATMGVLSLRLKKQLAEADHYGRLRIVYPHRDDLENVFIKVHSKVLVIDDDLIKVGSSNMNNRSMGFDTECDLNIEANGEMERSAIRRLRHRLVGEHLAMSPNEVEEALGENDSLIALIEARSGGKRSLRTLESEVDPMYERLMPDNRLIDPEKPVKFEDLASEILAGERREPRGKKKMGLHKIWILVGAIVVAVLLASAWRWTPLNEYLDLDSMRAWAHTIKESQYAPLILAAIYLIGGFIMFPITLLILSTVLTFGPVVGVIYALGGSLLSALATYWTGRLLGRDAVRQLSGARINKISKRLAQSGMLTVMAVRMLPVAPFTVVNLVAGASHIRFLDFTFGTIAGLIPGILALAAFGGGLERLIENPEPGTILIFLSVILAAGAILWLLRRFLGRKMESEMKGNAS